MLELLKQQIAECHHGLDRLRDVLDRHSRADGLNAAVAMAELGKVRLVLAKLADKGYGPIKPPAGT